MDNAIRFTPERGSVTVSVSGSDGDTWISVADTGLGLSIVRAIAEAHGGTAVAKNRNGGGALFTVRLPSASPRKDGQP